MSAILTTLLGGLLAISGGLVGIALNDQLKSAHLHLRGLCLYLLRHAILGGR